MKSLIQGALVAYCLLSYPINYLVMAHGPTHKQGGKAWYAARPTEFLQFRMLKLMASPATVPFGLAYEAAGNSVR